MKTEEQKEKDFDEAYNQLVKEGKIKNPSIIDRTTGYYPSISGKFLKQELSEGENKK